MIHDDDARLGGEREQKRSCVPDQSPHDPTGLRQGRSYAETVNELPSEGQRRERGVVNTADYSCHTARVGISLLNSTRIPSRTRMELAHFFRTSAWAIPPVS